MKRKLTAAVLGTIVLAIGTVSAVATTFPSVGGGKFEVTCKPGAIPDQAIDPIVAPGLTSAHMHTFFGAKTLTNTSTPASLQAAAHTAANTTCTIPQDGAGYWVPVACNGPCVPVAGGDPKRGPFVNAIKPVKIFAYYFGVKGAQEQPYPANLQMVAGNAEAQSPADEVPNTVFFSCGNGGGNHSSPNRAAPYDCTAANGVKGTDGVVAIIKFPYCENAAGLEYGATANTGNCPAGDTTLGQVQIHVHYGLDASGFQTGSALNFASGPYYTFHGDWMNGWDTTKLSALVSGCLDTDVDCGFLGPKNPGPGG